MSNKLQYMKPGEIVKAIRARDLETIKILVKHGVQRNIWTISEVAEMVGVNRSTVTRWVNNEK